jgi:prepilin-type N-terminal cleavage/methylation domain-containing protein
MSKGFTPTPEREPSQNSRNARSSRLVWGFTLIEVLIYVAIFSIVSGFFVGILLITLRVQGTQGGLVELSGQLNFAMQTIQRHVREATSISAPPGTGVPGATLTVNKPSGVVTIARGSCGTPAVPNAICVTESGSTLPITTGKIGVTTLNFTHFTNPSNHPSLPPVETIQIEMTANNLFTNPEQAVSRTLRSAASPLKQ